MAKQVKVPWELSYNFYKIYECKVEIACLFMQDFIDSVANNRTISKQDLDKLATSSKMIVEQMGNFYKFMNECIKEEEGNFVASAAASILHQIELYKVNDLSDADIVLNVQRECRQLLKGKEWLLDKYREQS